jgi:hypothetical protein
MVAPVEFFKLDPMEDLAKEDLAQQLHLSAASGRVSPF